MKQSVWKFPVELTDQQTIQMPQGAQLLAFAVQPGQIPSVWALVDPEAPLTERRFRLAGTGHPIAEEVFYVGTIIINDGTLVFHLFEEGIAP